MKFNEAMHVMQHLERENARRSIKLAVVVLSQGSIGCTPSVEVETMAGGFDWDAGTLLIYPRTPLTTLSPEEVADIRKSVSNGQSWHAYQAYKEQQEQVKAAEARRDDALALLQRFVSHFDERQRLSDSPDEAASAQNDLAWRDAVNAAREEIAAKQGATP